MAFVPKKEVLTTSRSKISIDYAFDASAKCADVNEPDFSTFLFVVNTTDNIVIYDPSSTGLGGTLSGNRIIFQFDTTSMSDTDRLIVIYEPKPFDDIRQLVVLNEILDQVKISNVYLQEVIGERLTVEDIDCRDKN